VTPDATWSAISEACQELIVRVEGSTLAVRPVHRRSFSQWTVTDGMAVFDNWTDVFEPVRRRRTDCGSGLVIKR
jgi:hypothetical protein